MENKKNIAINGLGRIGRMFLKLTLENDDFNIVAINDLSDIENMAYLLQYDSVYKTYKDKVSVEGDNLVIGKNKIPYFSISNPEELPWSDLSVDLVVEATGVFASYEKSKVHLKAGAKKVLISAPVKDKPVGVEGATILFGVNEEKAKTCEITSNGSCTTNAVATPLMILDESLGVEKAILNTIHSYTATQKIVDGVSKKNKRLGRAGALNMIPGSTGAAVSTSLVLTNLENKFDGVSVRVPTPSGSLADITFVSKRNTTVDEVNEILSKAAKNVNVRDVFTVVDDDVVSSDIIGMTEAAIVDLSMTRVVGGNLVKIFSWYDNEVGYTNTLYKHAKVLADSV